MFKFHFKSKIDYQFTCTSKLYRTMELRSIFLNNKDMFNYFCPSSTIASA